MVQGKYAAAEEKNARKTCFHCRNKYDGWNELVRSDLTGQVLAVNLRNFEIGHGGACL